jgi:hypothetical protein
MVRITTLASGSQPTTTQSGLHSRATPRTSSHTPSRCGSSEAYGLLFGKTPEDLCVRRIMPRTKRSKKKTLQEREEELSELCCKNGIDVSSDGKYSVLVDTSSPSPPVRVSTLTRSKAKVAIAASPQKKANGKGKRVILHPPDPASLVLFPSGSAVYGESQSPLSPPCHCQGKDKINLSTVGDSLPPPAPLTPS